MRPLIQYDLDEPELPTTSPVSGPSRNTNDTRRPPVKRRKRNHYPYKTQPVVPVREAPVPHWDDPGDPTDDVIYDEQDSSAVATGSVAVLHADTFEDGEEPGYSEDVEDENVMNADDQEEEEEEEGRLLTHEEIWDDSALINAWNSAEAEYEAYHGASKSWKSEAVKKSPLWYNKPYTAPSRPKPGPSQPKSVANKHIPSPTEREDGAPEPDTAPLDFNTYVPTHDPSLGAPSFNGAGTPNANVASSAPFFLLPPSTTSVSRDEAFNNALSAMYWTGYWTAVFHSHSAVKESSLAVGVTEENGIEVDENGAQDEDLVPTQR